MSDYNITAVSEDIYVVEMPAEKGDPGIIAPVANNTIVGNISGSTAAPIGLTVEQVRGMLLPTYTGAPTQKFLSNTSGVLDWSTVDLSQYARLNTANTFTSPSRNAITLNSIASTAWDGVPTLDIVQPGSISTLWRPLRLGASFYVDVTPAGAATLNINGGTGDAVNLIGGMLRTSGRIFVGSPTDDGVSNIQIESSDNGGLRMARTSEGRSIKISPSDTSNGFGPSIVTGNSLTVRSGGTVKIRSASGLAVRNEADSADGSLSLGSITVSGKIQNTGFNTTDSQLRIGSVELQSYSQGVGWIGENLFFNGSNFQSRATGGAGGLFFQGTEAQLRTYVSTSAGSTLSPNSQLKANPDGTVCLGGSINSNSGNTTGAGLIVTGTTATFAGTLTAGAISASSTVSVAAPTGFTGNLINATLNGVNRFRIDEQGNIYGQNGAFTVINSIVNAGRFAGSSGQVVLYDTGGFPALALASGANIFWETGTSIAGSRNVGLVKSASGQIGVNDGTNGSTNWRDLILRDLTATRAITVASTVGDGGTVLTLSSSVVGATTLELHTYLGGLINFSKIIAAPRVRITTGGGACVSGTAGAIRIRNDADTADYPLMCSNLTASGTVTSTHSSSTTDLSTLDLTTSQTRMHKNTLSGLLKIFANDGGIIKSVTLT